MLPDVFHHNKERDAVFEFGGDTREGYIKSRGGGWSQRDGLLQETKQLGKNDKTHS